MSLGVDSKEIQDQINKLFSSILIEQQKINSIRGPFEEKKNLTKSLLQDYEKMRGRGFFYEYCSSGKGHGPFTELIDGSIKYDLIGGIGPNLLGHSHPLYIKSHLEAATVDSIMCGNLLTYQEPYILTKILLEQVKETKLKHFWFTGSGSFANDTALKMIWQKKNPHTKVIAFNNAFAGRSVATQDITFNAEYREGMPKSVQVHHVPHFNQKDSANSLTQTLSELNSLWKKSQDYCAIMIELVQGEAGFIYGTSEYYKEIFKWAKDKGLFIWIDEVQTFARTHELFAFKAFGLEEYVDIVTVGKALQNCGVLFSDELNPKPGLVAGTFNGSISSLKMGEKIIRYLTEGNFYGVNGRIKDLERTFITKLKYLSQNSCKNKIGHVGGIGTMISFEIGDSSKELTTKFLKALFEKGVIAFTAGKSPARVRFLLPLSLRNEHIEEIFQIIENTILEVV